MSTQKPECRGLNPCWPVTSCMILSKLTFCVSSFFICQVAIIIVFTYWTAGKSKGIDIKYLEEYVAHTELYITFAISISIITLFYMLIKFDIVGKWHANGRGLLYKLY